MSVADSRSGVSDDAVEKATGRHPDAWFGLLDAVGAAAWDHTRIARWLVSEHGVDGWWAQSLTVRFEQARGKRAPGQQADGTFTASVSRTIPLEQKAALDALVGALEVHLGASPDRVSRETVYQSATFALPNGERLVASANPSRDGRTSVALTHSRIRDGERIGAAKAELSDVLKGLAETLG